MKTLFRSALMISGLMTLPFPALAATSAIVCDNCSASSMRGAAEGKGVSLGNGRHRIQVGSPTTGAHRVYRVTVENNEFGSRELTASASEAEDWQTFQKVQRPEYIIDIPDDVAPTGHRSPAFVEATSAYLRNQPDVVALVKGIWAKYFPVVIKVRWNDGYTAEFEFQTLMSSGAAFRMKAGSLRDPDGNPVGDWREGADASPYEGLDGATFSDQGLADLFDALFDNGIPVYVVSSLNLAPNVTSTFSCTDEVCTLVVRW